jgi:hypothetical protein
MIFGNHWSMVRLGSLIFENRGVLIHLPFPSPPPQVPQKENLPTMDGGFCSQGENLAYEEDKTIYL